MRELDTVTDDNDAPCSNVVYVCPSVLGHLHIKHVWGEELIVYVHRYDKRLCSLMDSSSSSSQAVQELLWREA